MGTQSWFYSWAVTLFLLIEFTIIALCILLNEVRDLMEKHHKKQEELAKVSELSSGNFLNKAA